MRHTRAGPTPHSYAPSRSMPMHCIEFWTAEEDGILRAAIEEYGPSWTKVATYLPDRSVASIRNRYQRMTSTRPRWKTARRTRCKLCGQWRRGHTCTYRVAPAILPASSSDTEGDTYETEDDTHVDEMSNGRVLRLPPMEHTAAWFQTGGDRDPVAHVSLRTTRAAR